MVTKILGLEDNVNSINDIRKFVKKSQIHQINIPNKNKFLIETDGIEFFDSLDVMDQLRKINSIKMNFDLCVTSSWTTSRLAYLADMKYIINFVGNDIRIPPFIKNSKPFYFKEKVNNLNFLQRVFYKNVLDSAAACVAASDESYNDLKKYRNDGMRIDRTIVNTKLFHPDIRPIEMEKRKFTFFSPQRIGREKGIDILWKAIPLCKSDFEILQVEWYDETSEEAKILSHEILQQKPPQVKLIPQIPRKEIARYYAFADAVLGEMRMGLLNNIEREAALCKKPVICYYNPTMKYVLDGKKISAPFLPNSNDLTHIAEIIDKVVESEQFRNELAEKEYDFVKEYGDPDKAAEEWDNVFEKIHYNLKRQKSSRLKLFLRLLLYSLSHNLFFKDVKLS